MTTPHTARAYNVATDERSVTATLVDAFRADPFMRALLPRKQKYDRIAPYFFGGTTWVLHDS